MISAGIVLSSFAVGAFGLWQANQWWHIIYPHCSGTACVIRATAQFDSNPFAPSCVLGINSSVPSQQSLC